MKADLEDYKSRFSTILNEKNTKMEKIKNLEQSVQSNEKNQEAEKRRNQEIADEKSKIIEKFEKEVENQTTKLEKGEKYRLRDSFPNTHSVVTRYHKECFKEIDAAKKKSNV